MRLNKGTLLSVVSLVAAIGCRNVEVEVDVMPGVYPNVLTEDASALSVALIAPREMSRRELESLKSVQVTASSTFAAGEPVVSAVGDPSFTDVNGDGRPDLVATFSTGELRLAGLLGPHTTRLSVRATVSGEAYCEGTDRLFDAGNAVFEVSPPSGPLAVGTTSLFAVDRSRPGVAGAWRGLVIRLWYPAASATDQPTTYFLDDREAQANVPTGLPVILPPTLFDAIHAWSQRDVQPKRGKRPTLLLSTGLGMPLTFYSGLAQDLASHGYIIVGIEHPDGSGVVVYPDGTRPVADPTTSPTELAHGWAKDLQFVLGWLGSSASRQGADPSAQDAIKSIDRARVGALGHSLGGAAAIWASAESSAIRGAVDIDGALWGDVVTAGPTTPTMLMLFEGHFGNDPTLDEFLAHARSRVYRVDVKGSKHADFSDMGLLARGLASKIPGFDPAMLGLGTIAADRILAVQSAYLRAFFDAVLEGSTPAILNGPSAEFPEVTLTVQ